MAEMLRWIELDREALPGLIAEGSWPPGPARRVSAPRLHASELYVGVRGGGIDSEDFLHSGDARAALLVVDERSARDVLAWLATYSPASFPVTQSIRVVLSADFHAQAESATSGQNRSLDFSYWPCIVFGELLGQGEQAVSIDSVALSRAGACFSFAQARADELYGAASEIATRCEQRLNMLQADRLFVKRSIPVEELAPVWSCTRSSLPQGSLQRELVRLVDDAANGRAANSSGQSATLLTSVGFDALGLSSGPIETRVRSFQAFSNLLESVRNAELGRAKAMLLAAAAFCVGNGTSHISLLDEFFKKVPAAYAWFGLFAAIAGPRTWDPSWNRAINSMGRLLRGRFELCDAPTSDLSWMEYDFLRGVARPAEFLKQVPKLYPKSLSVEVVPGATCQLRVNDDSASARTVHTSLGVSPLRIEEARDVRPPQVIQSGPPLVTSPDLTASLAELQRALSRSQELVRRAIAASGGSPTDQPSLFEDSAAKPRKRGSQKKSKPA